MKRVPEPLDWSARHVSYPPPQPSPARGERAKTPTSPFGAGLPTPPSSGTEVAIEMKVGMPQ